LTKNSIFDEKLHFCRKFPFLRKISIFDEKFYFWWKIPFLKIPFLKKSFLPRFSIFDTNFRFVSYPKFQFLPKRFLANFWHKFRFLTKNSNLAQNIKKNITMKKLLLKNFAYFLSKSHFFNFRLHGFDQNLRYSSKFHLLIPI